MPDGSIKYIWQHGVGEQDENGKIKAVHFTLQDITKQKLLEGQTLQANAWMKCVLNSSMYSIISTNPEGIITTFNSAAEQMLGYKAGEVINKLSPAVIHDLNEVQERAEVLSQELGQVIEPGFRAFVAKAEIYGSDINQWTYIRKDGTRLQVKLCVTVVKGENGEIIGYLGIAEDLTEHLKLQSEVESQQLRLISSAKMASLGEMAGGVAHEINNPLAIISGKIDVLKLNLENGNLDKNKTLGEIQKIETTILRIAKIIKGLKSFSRNAEGDRMENCSIDQIIGDTLEFCVERFKKQSVDLKVDVKSKAQILCRPAEISQIILNLLNNAHDAIESLSEKWIELSVYEEGEKIVISVMDSGRGIPEAVAEKMMQPFFTTKAVGKGTGLGLSIALGIAEAHGGNLKLDRSSKNTRFTLELPISKPISVTA